MHTRLAGTQAQVYSHQGQARFTHIRPRPGLLTSGPGQVYSHQAQVYSHQPRRQSSMKVARNVSLNINTRCMHVAPGGPSSCAAVVQCGGLQCGYCK